MAPARSTVRAFTMSEHNVSLGRCSEDAAKAYLAKQGYRIIEANYRTKLGEIDIIAKEKDTLCFIEVKARSSYAYGFPEEAVGRRKQQKISRAALMYLQQHQLLHHACRFDVLSVLDDGQSAPVFALIKNAFNVEGKYRY